MHWRLIILTFVLFSSGLFAQQDRVNAPVDGRQRFALKGVIRPEVQAMYDQGPLAGDTQLTGLTLYLKPSPEQQAALERLLVDQQDASSPEYHHWLTAAQFADRFGLSSADLGKISAWLKDQGFSIGHVAQGRNWILFSGTAQQVQAAFGAEIHRYQVDGERHYANATEPSIPAALAPVVQTIRGLDDFHMKPPRRTLKPAETFDGQHYIAPGDLGVIYDINPLYAQNINGSGQKIAVMGQTAINLADIETFRGYFSLPANDPQLMLVPTSSNPGITADQSEADLDVEWSGAVAPNASILFVYSSDVLLSTSYAIDQKLAPIISYSYGGCEQQVSGTSASNANAIRSTAQQANAQGITWLAASGDQGAAACDSGRAPAKKGLAVNLPASIPEVTGVGGTEFNEGNGNYWSATDAPNGTSALSFIPEMAWNDTLATGILSSTGGGMSIFFAKPAWQTGTGVPADNVRDVPDISFPAANQHDPYIVQTGGKVQYIGGTSVATPVFAGILALLNQYLAGNGGGAGLGNINPNLYNLAQSTPGIFHDVTVGSNQVPCQVGSTNCNSGTIGYNAGVGYDLATGLGSADVYNLVTNWSSRPVTGTITTVTANPASLLITQSTSVTATVKAASGTTTPTGSVSFSVGSTSLGTANLSGSGGTATASVTVAGNLLVTGTNTIKANYGGSANFGGSSGSVSVTVGVPTANSAVIPSAVPDPVYQQQPDANGFSWFLTLRLTEVAGVSTTLTGFTFNGQDESSQIVNLFGSQQIPAHGTLSAAVGVKLANPGNVVFGFSGADSSGAKWSQQLTVPFYGPQLSGGMELSSSPDVVASNRDTGNHCDPGYPYYQELNLQELNGHEIYLNKFLSGTFDDSANIEGWFGSWRLAPLGSLQAGICWSVSPQTLNYEVDGIDDQGNTIKTTLSVVFQSGGRSAGALSVSKSSLELSVKPGASTQATLNVNVPAGQDWTLSIFPSNQTTNWLVVSPLSGTGPSTVTLLASAAGLSNGAYTATLVFQSVNTIPQFVDVPVALVAGLSSTTTIAGLANGAAFNQTFAPGMILSVFGTNLTNSATALYAPIVPLPFSLGGTTATVNGVPAPFYYASPTQLNIQIPYETPEGSALLAVNNNGQVAGFYFEVSATAPGIFVGAGSALVPVASAARGQVLSLFMTGEGDVSPPIATGATPVSSTPLDQLPSPRNTPFSMTVAGLPVTPQFVGIPYGLVGETQVNFQVPSNTPLGMQNVVVTVGSNKSVAAQINVTQ